MELNGNFIEGANKMVNKVIDSQKSKVYAAESKFRTTPYTSKYSSVISTSIHDCQRYVDLVCNETWFRARFGERHIRVEAGRNGGVAYGNRITLGVWARQETVILHEIAHCVAPRGIKHGAEYAGVFMFLVKQMLGAEAASNLRGCYKEKRVRYSYKALPKATKVLTTKQKEVKERKQMVAAKRIKKMQQVKPLDFAEKQALKTYLQRAVASGMLGESGDKKRRQALSIARAI